MTFTIRLEQADGTPADPPTIESTVTNWRVGETIPMGRESHTHSMKWRRDLYDALITLAVGVGVACALGALFVWLWAPPPTPENSSPPPEPFLFLFGAVVGLVVTLVARVLFGRLVLRRKRRVG
jgi:uncharacterized RDD family membrane protein YckC